MNVSTSALKAIVPHFRVRGHTLLISQGDAFSHTEIDLRRVAAHKLPQMAEDLYMKKRRTKFEATVSVLIFFGMVLLWQFGWTHWPATTDIAAYVAGAILIIVFLCRFIIALLREQRRAKHDAHQRS